MSIYAPAVDESAARGGHSSDSDVRLARRLFAYLGAHRKLFFLALCLYPLDAASVILPPYLVRQILDIAIPQRDWGLLHLCVGIYLTALVVQFGSGFASQYVLSVLGQRAMRSLRTDLFAHVQRLPAAFYDKNPLGRVQTRLTNDVEALGEIFATGAVTIIADLITITAIVATMLVLDARLTAYAFLVLPPLIGLAAVFQRYARRAFRSIRKHLALINTFLSEHLTGMSVVQIFRQEERTSAEFLDLNRRYRDANRSAVLFDAGLFSLVEAIGSCAVAALIYYGASDMSAGLVGAGTLVAFIQYIRRFFIPVRDLSAKYTLLQSALAAAERIFHLLDEPVPIASPANARQARKLERSIEFRDVWFSYRNPAGDDDWVLRSFSTRITRGERVALVGATGSGKTTILKLLNRFYDAQRGSVCIDDVDVRQLDLSHLRRLFAVVLQDVHLFSGTVMDNLALTEEVTAEDARRAARAVQADAFVERLPMGYETQVRSRGLQFSAGERQLLAFSRALALDPEVLVLDEATSNVDSETEARVQHALDVLLQDRTALIVAHRLSTIKKVDRIVVLGDGHTHEEGTHEQLMDKPGGLYRSFVEQSAASNRN